MIQMSFRPRNKHSLQRLRGVACLGFFHRQTTLHSFSYQYFQKSNFSNLQNNVAKVIPLCNSALSGFFYSAKVQTSACSASTRHAGSACVHVALFHRPRTLPVHKYLYIPWDQSFLLRPHWPIRSHGLRVWGIFTAKLPAARHAARAFSKSSFFPIRQKRVFPEPSLALGG